MIQFFREQKLLAGLLLVSILVIVVGAIMIQYNKNAVQSAPINTQVNMQVSAQEQTAQDVVEAMTTIATVAGQELQNSQAAAPQPAVGDNIPQSSVDHVAALNGRIPEEGSNDWCEVMMVKPSSEWAASEQELFAKHCL